MSPHTDAGALLTFQKRVVNWLMECFSMEVCRDGTERNHRFLEEALELVQSLGCTRSEAHQLVDYVFDRPIGEPMQELGGVQVTLAALCFPHDLDMNEARERELERVWTKIEAIRAKQLAKPKHSPLPQAASQGREGGEEPMAYWFEHPTFGMELSLDQLSGDAAQRGWIETPLYALSPPVKTGGGEQSEVQSREAIIRVIASDPDFGEVASRKDCERLADAILALRASQSAPDFKATQKSAESDPAVTPDCSGADTATSQGRAGGERSEVQTDEALAWHCCDERYPWINGIVTTSPITHDAWRDSGIKHQPLYPRTSDVAQESPYAEAFRREEARADKLGREVDELRAVAQAQQLPIGPRELKPITMSEIRLAAGEGKLSAHDVLAAANAVLRMRQRALAPSSAHRGGEV